MPNLDPQRSTEIRGLDASGRPACGCGCLSRKHRPSAARFSGVLRSLGPPLDGASLGRQISTPVVALSPISALSVSGRGNRMPAS
jgi:hypothetical protein